MLFSNLPVASLHQLDHLGSENDFNGARYRPSRQFGLRFLYPHLLEVNKHRIVHIQQKTASVATRRVSADSRIGELKLNKIFRKIEIAVIKNKYTYIYRKYTG